jgi:hypothetical protein
MAKYNHRTIHTVYLDMDGVLCDFDSYYRSIYGVNCRDDDNEDNWYEFVNNQGFQELDRMPDYDDLFSMLNELYVDIEILSCITSRKNNKEVAKQKVEWLFRNSLENNVINFTITKQGKGNYANPNVLLIDDSDECISAFKQSGGYALKYTGIDKLKFEIEYLLSEDILCVRSLGHFS